MRLLQCVLLRTTAVTISKLSIFLIIKLIRIGRCFTSRLSPRMIIRFTARRKRGHRKSYLLTLSKMLTHITTIKQQQYNC